MDIQNLNIDKETDGLFNNKTGWLYWTSKSNGSRSRTIAQTYTAV